MEHKNKMLKKENLWVFTYYFSSSILIWNFSWTFSQKYYYISTFFDGVELR